MRVLRHIAAVVPVTLLFVAGGTAFASNNLIRIKVQAGTSVGIGYTTGGQVTSQGATDSDNNGEVEFTLPKDVEGVAVCKRSDNRDLYYRVKVNAAGVTLASLGPFAVPPFTDASGVSALVSVIVIDELLNQGNPFIVNDLVSISNGTTAATQWITFKNGTSLSGTPQARAMQLMDDGVLNGLPNFTGTGEVELFDFGGTVPAVSTVGLIAIGLVVLSGGLMVFRRRQGSVAA